MDETSQEIIFGLRMNLRRLVFESLMLFVVFAAMALGIVRLIQDGESIGLIVFGSLFSLVLLAIAVNGAVEAHDVYKELKQKENQPPAGN